MIIQLFMNLPPQVVQERPSGSAFLIGWDRLAQSLADADMLQSSEVVSHFVVDGDRGLEVFVRAGEVGRVRGGAVCRGSWMLGTACGKCSRCHTDAPAVIAALRASNESLNAKLKVLVSCVPPPMPAHNGMRIDLVTGAKIALFDAVRAQLYDDAGELR